MEGLNTSFKQKRALHIMSSMTTIFDFDMVLNCPHIAGDNSQAHVSTASNQYIAKIAICGNEL